jgi:Cu/Ag efflux protein CusF
MIRAVTAASLIAVALVFAVPAHAQEAMKQAKPTKPKPRQFTGEITEMANMSVTLKNKDGETKMFTLTDKSKVTTVAKKAAELSDLKVGDKVMVRYVEEDGKNVVQRIAPPGPYKKKPKMEETR